MVYRSFKQMKIESKNYILKKMTTDMVGKNYLKWFKDESIKKYIDSSPIDIKDLKSYVKNTINNPNTFFWAIFYKDKHVGNIKIFEIDFKKKIGRLGILIGEKKFRNLGLGSEVIDAVKKFLIKKGILYLWLGVEKQNIAAINSYKKSGFFKYKIHKKYIYMKCNIFTSKLILGGAQLNSNYGITNFEKNYQSSKEAKKIINLIKKKNVNHIDGAEEYKIFKEDKLRIIKDLKIDTKILLKDISNYKSLKLKIKKYLSNNIKVETLFIHDGDKILENSFRNKINILYKLKKDKIIKKIGISIYDFTILKKVISKFNIDVIQLPYNLVDRRVERFKKLFIKNKIQIYARSIFLQGTILKKVNRIVELQGIYEKVTKFSKITKQSNYQACLNFVLNNDLVDKIIVGVRNSKEMKTLLNFKSKPNSCPIRFTKYEKLCAYYPNKWKN